MSAFAALNSVSSDIGINFGSTDFMDEDVALVPPSGGVVAAALGALPVESDVSGYSLSGDGTVLLCFDTTVALPGPVYAAPGDVVRSDGSTFVLVFDASANGVPEGARCDAVSENLQGQLILSFDIGVSLPGGFSLPGGLEAADEDLVLVVSASSFALLFDGSAEGVPRELDVDAAQLTPSGTIALSFDIGGSIAGLNFGDEDVLEYNPRLASWTMAFDGSLQGAAWEPGDLDAVALPEPGGVVAFLAGVFMLSKLRPGREGRKH